MENFHLQIICKYKSVLLVNLIMGIFFIEELSKFNHIMDELIQSTARMSLHSSSLLVSLTQKSI
jgi:hypothetical protein